MGLSLSPNIKKLLKNLGRRCKLTVSPYFRMLDILPTDSYKTVCEYSE